MEFYSLSLYKYRDHQVEKHRYMNLTVLATDFFIEKGTYFSCMFLAPDGQQFPDNPGPRIKHTCVVDRHRFDADPDPDRHHENYTPSFIHAGKYGFFLLLVTDLPR
jgi:hypothetical protein